MGGRATVLYTASLNGDCQYYVVCLRRHYLEFGESVLLVVYRNPPDVEHPGNGLGAPQLQTASFLRDELDDIAGKLWYRTGN